MSDYGHQEKKISFVDKDKHHADLVIRLKHDGLTMSKFFRALIKGYIEQDYAILDFIERFKISSGSQSQKQAKIIKDIQKEGSEIKNKFALNEKEVENIFDILEKEHPDL
jgi:lambda repressor-like predicted transcriptional regulator